MVRDVVKMKDIQFEKGLFENWMTGTDGNYSIARLTGISRHLDDFLDSDLFISC